MKFCMNMLLMRMNVDADATPSPVCMLTLPVFSHATSAIFYLHFMTLCLIRQILGDGFYGEQTSQTHEDFSCSMFTQLDNMDDCDRL